jgi:hypothetical protein
MNPRPATPEVAGREPPLPTVLRGRRLFVARVAWLALAALTLGLFFASVPVAYARFGTLCESAGCDFMQLSREGASALERLGLSVGFYAVYNMALRIAIALGFWAIGAVLFWKRSDDRLILCASIALVTFGAVQADTLYMLAEAHPRWELPVALVYFVGEAAFFVLFCVFPDGRFVPRWTRWAAVVWIFYQLLAAFLPDSPISPRNWPLVIDASLLLVLIGSLVVAQIYRYRRVSTQEQRQQTKWVVFGFAAAIALIIWIILIAWIFALTRPGIPQVIFALVFAPGLSLSTLLIPLSVGVAIRRYRLWDIDFIVNRTLVYGSLSAALAAVFAITDTLLQSLFFFITGVEQSRIATFASVVVIAVAFQPLRQRIERLVNRLVQQRIEVDV